MMMKQSPDEKPEELDDEPASGKLSRSDDQHQSNEEQQVEMSIKEWIKVIGENREKLLADVMMISDERNTMDVDVEQEIRGIITANPVVEHLMGIAKCDFRM